MLVLKMTEICFPLFKLAWFSFSWFDFASIGVKDQAAQTQRQEHEERRLKSPGSIWSSARFIERAHLDSLKAGLQRFHHQTSRPKLERKVSKD